MRRLRPNIVIGGVDGLTEREWIDGQLLVGGAIIRLDSLRTRCHTITIDPDSLRVNADVVRAGAIRVGDSVRLLAPVL